MIYGLLYLLFSIGLIVLAVKILLPLVPFVIGILFIGFIAVVVKAKKENREINSEFISGLFRRNNDDVIEGDYTERMAEDDSESNRQ